MKAAALAAVILLAAAEPSAAAEPRVNPDRPDRANSLDTVAPGMAQIESGLVFLRDASGDRPMRRLTAEGSLRLGITETFELDGVGDLFVRERGEGQGTSGVGDAALAAKWRLLDAEGWRPGFGLLPFVKFPTASHAKGLGTGRMDFGGFLGLGQDLPGDVHLDLNVGLAALGLAAPPGGLFLQRSLAASFSWVAVEWVTPFWEIFYDSRDRPAGRHSVGTDFGFVFFLHQRIALDVAGEVGLAGNTPDWALRAGVTLLLGSLPANGASAAVGRSPRPAAAAAVFDTAVGPAYHPAVAATPGVGVRP
jgi:hypothetical protein